MKTIVLTYSPTPTSIIQNLVNEVWTQTQDTPIIWKCVKSNTNTLLGTTFSYKEMIDYLNQNTTKNLSINE